MDQKQEEGSIDITFRLTMRKKIMFFKMFFFTEPFQATGDFTGVGTPTGWFVLMALEYRVLGPSWWREICEVILISGGCGC